MSTYIKKLLRESLDLAVVEGLIDEDYPTSWNIEEFKKLTKFTERVKYCEANLQRISSGSGRIVYKIDEVKVLKLAKNAKGVAQNEVEIQWGNERYFSSILAQTFHYHPNHLWVEMELARKVKASDFKRLEGNEFDFAAFGSYLIDQINENKGRKLYFASSYDADFFNENQLTCDTIDFLLNIGAPPGDAARLNSWGLVKRDGQDCIVMVDYGLTDDVYSTHYEPKKQRLTYYQ